ncbi:MAG: hypothetical protein HY093_00975 [Candidatus Liptonbacteria bacterium]|nr:hypothetical protein [Candidatus Liptonbacteria bacterium]
MNQYFLDYYVKIKSVIHFPFWSEKEKFLILEVHDQRTEGFLLSLDSEKNLNLETTWDDFSLARLSRQVRRHLQNWKVVVSADSRLALTAILPIKLEREAGLASSPLSSIELENLLAQASARIFTQVRGEASRELGIEELDTILIDNRVSNFKVDGHHVMNPLEFRAKKIDAVLELTLTTRAIFDHWKNFFSIGETKNFFFTESARAELFALKKIRPLPLNLLILNREGHSELFRLEKAAVGELVHRSKIKWFSNLIFESLTSTLGVSDPVARKIYDLYLSKNLSPRLTRHFNLSLKPVFSSLFRHLENHPVKGPLYMDIDLKLPPFIPKKQGGAILADLPLGDLLDQLGFRTDFTQWPWPNLGAFRHLAPFFEFYYNNEELAINHWLRRRLHWLGSSR